MKTKQSIASMICLIVLCFLKTELHAQNVGINTTGNAPQTSAGLDIDFADRGLLIPRVALSSRNDVSTITGGTPTNSLLIYNTATAGILPYTVYPGYYFFLDSIWVRLAERASTTILSSDQTNSNATPNTLQNISDLSFPVASGLTYRFKFFIVYTTANSTNGSRWTINGPSTTNLHYHTGISFSAASRSFYEGLSTYNSPSNCNTASATTASNIAEIEGIITPNANGTVVLRFASEVGGAAIVAKANLSYVQWEILR